MTEPTKTSPQSADAPLTYFVGGMDCANCVQSVERMIGRLPGAGEVKTSFSRQTLQLHLDETQTPRATLERNLQALGYAPALQAGAAAQPEASAQQHDQSGQSHSGHNHADHNHADHDHTDHNHSHAEDGHQHGAGEEAAAHGHVHEVAPAGTPWYNTGQGRLVLLSGALLLLAWLFSFIEPTYAKYGFVAATLLGVWPLLKKSVAAARLGDFFSINMLVTLAALGAVLIGQAAEGAVVVFFFEVGELLEGVAAGRARAGIQSLAALAPKTALLLEAGGTREVPADSLTVGQQVQVNPGARVPADGVITAGTSHLDDSPVTGESMPVSKKPGDRVFAGSINAEGVLSVQVDKTASDNTIARIITMVEDAESSKAQTARFIDRFSRWYTPGVVLIAALVAAVPPLLGQPWHTWLYKGLALLLIGCPCALVLSVPAAITSGISAGTRRGLLIKGGAVLETIGSVKTVAFDKTGTLTAGQPRITDILGADRTEVLRLAAAAEAGSSHPLARAITTGAQEQNLQLPAAADAKAISGKGVSAVIEGRVLGVSSPKAAAQQVPLSAEFQSAIAQFEGDGKTAVVLHDQTQVLGVIALRDEPRSDAKAGLDALRALGVQTVMLTGDNVRTAQAIADALGVTARADLLPENKLQIIDELRARGGVAMVGDGINDAPALARADVGIAMGGGTDVALETAGAALLRERVGDVVNLVQLSRDTMSNIKVNIAFALGLKLIFLVTTLLGYTNLWMAVLADTGATAIVTANALRLLNWKGKTV